MTLTRTMTSAHKVVPLRGGHTRRRLGKDTQQAIAVALFLAVLFAVAVFVALAVPSIPDIGSLYVTTT